MSFSIVNRKKKCPAPLLKTPYGRPIREFDIRYLEVIKPHPLQCCIVVCVYCCIVARVFILQTGMELDVSDEQVTSLRQTFQRLDTDMDG